MVCILPFPVTPLTFALCPGVFRLFVFSFASEMLGDFEGKTGAVERRGEGEEEGKGEGEGEGEGEREES